VVITVNDYKYIREHWLKGESQRTIAKQLGISRNTVKKYCAGTTVPWERKEYERNATVLTEEVRQFIACCLAEDEDQHSAKQNHTARRIYNRLVEEQGFTGGESTVRKYVQEIKAKVQEAYVPLMFVPGDAMQIDWGEATVYLCGEKKSIYLFCARLCSSEAPIVFAYRRQNSESFLEALVECFSYFGGVPRRVIFDNAKIAVKEGFGANARATESYSALAAHYGFSPVFCNVASGNEKGLVEGLVGYARRNFLVPIPRVDSMEELNNILKARCEKYLSHRIQGKTATVGELLRTEKKALYSLPSYRFDPARRAESKVSPYSTVRFDTNNYSVPVKYCGKHVAIRAMPEQVEIYFEGTRIASHQRCFLRHQSIYRMEHYLPLLEQKGRAIFQARPVRDNVPEYFLDWLKKQEYRPKELVAKLRLYQELGADAVMRGETNLIQVPALEIEDLVCVSAVDLTAYDALCRAAKEVCV
jgi:transposase